jgi:cobalt-zinc-cadmium efflux system membrane fusion protein
MTIEPVRSVTVPADEITAPAKIEVNPNRVGHAMLPAPGRIVRVMVKLGDSVAQGQPVVAIESSVVAEAESGHIQSDASVRQAELAVAKAEADLARETDLFEHQAVAQKEVLAAQTTAELAKASLNKLEARGNRRAGAWNFWASRSGNSSNRSLSLPQSQASAGGQRGRGRVSQRNQHAVGHHR